MKNFLKGLAVGYSVGGVTLIGEIVRDQVRDNGSFRKGMIGLDKDSYRSMVLAFFLWPAFFVHVMEEAE